MGYQREYQFIMAIAEYMYVFTCDRQPGSRHSRKGIGVSVCIQGPCSFYFTIAKILQVVSNGQRAGYLTTHIILHCFLYYNV